ncbi:MAG: DUF938 domain-containing protein [Ketobacteraceae bacterium]|nr:DUF938 domain-containing protein [Ketobacteraceae bacterium]
MNLPFSQACENNQEPIRQVMSTYLREPAHLLEIGSGTGQHGAYITAHHPGLHWHPTDREENLEGISAWVRHAGLENFHPPIPLDINQAQWPGEKVDIVYSANTAHIMHWEEVEKMFAFVPRVLKAEGHFMLYGPFNYQGRYTSESNARFDEWLRSEASHRAIRDFENINALAEQHNLRLVKDHAMPANNRMLVWLYTL